MSDGEHPPETGITGPDKTMLWLFLVGFLVIGAILLVDLLAGLFR